MAIKIQLKRIYEEPAEDDGCRMFVDRLWARGVTKQAAQIDVWAKVLTPSNELRKWFHANLDRTEEFAARYVAELSDRTVEIDALFEPLDCSVLTLVTATKDFQRGHAAVLRDFLKRKFRASR